MRRKRRLSKEEPELNITAFLNLMVVLIPFLLLNAVFTQLSVIELNLPKSSDSSPSTQDKPEQPKLDLEVQLRKSTLALYDTVSHKTITQIAIDDNGFDSVALQDALKTLKKKHPKINTIRILAAQATPYELIIQSMDTVRYYYTDINGSQIAQELFPAISLGNVGGGE